MSENKHYELFRLQGVEERSKLVFKKKNNIVAYNDGIDIERSSEREYIPLTEIINVYIQEPITDDVEHRTTVIDYYEEGEEFRYELEDSVYPGLSRKMEELLSAEWVRIKEKKKLPETIKWFQAVQAVFLISDGRDLELFGGMYNTPESAVELRKVHYESWGIRNEEDADKMLRSLLDGRANKEFKIITDLLRDGANEVLSFEGVLKETGADRETLQRIYQSHDLKDRAFKDVITQITLQSGDNGLWAWDLVRAMHLSASMYICGYYTREKALDVCLEAGQKMQNVFRNWDAMMTDYLLGYSYWSNESLSDADTEAYNRAHIYESLRRADNSPYNLLWDLLLKREW